MLDRLAATPVCVDRQINCHLLESHSGGTYNAISVSANNANRNAAETKSGGFFTGF